MLGQGRQRTRELFSILYFVYIAISHFFFISRHLPFRPANVKHELCGKLLW